MKIIIVGGVAAGMSAASKIKRLDAQAEVVVYEAGQHLSYGACGLPYYVNDTNNDAEKLIARTSEQFKKNGINTCLEHKVLKVIPTDKQILVLDQQKNHLFVDHYDRLLIATGASAIMPAIAGREAQGVYQLKTLDDGLKLKKEVLKAEHQNIVVVGGGYIGIEIAEALQEIGKNVTVIEFGDKILAPFDSEITHIAQEHLLEMGVQLQLQEAVQQIVADQADCVSQVVTNRAVYPADLVVLATGVRPATEFLKDSGVLLADNGAIMIDREMRTNLPDIYAAGDCAQVYHLGKEENTYIPLGTTANKCGRIAGENMLGAHHKYIGTLGSAAIKIGKYELGRTGLSEAEAKQLGYACKTVFVTSQDHPNYYPNPTKIQIKLIYQENNLRLLGAQAIGEKGVVLRIDLFAMAIHNKMTTSELGMVDLCYAPPFAGVWDAVHVASNAAK